MTLLRYDAPVRPLFIRRSSRTLGSFDTPESKVTQGSVEKFLLELPDGNAIEAVLLGHFGPRVALLLEADAAIERRLGRAPLRAWARLQRKISWETCVSTQVGCALDCRFCASSTVPFLRNLTSDELESEIAAIESRIPAGGRLRKVLFAGIGEPLLNYPAIASVIRALLSRGIAAKVNTVGVIPSLESLFADGLEVELAVSIHAPNDELRAELMPAGKGYKLAEIKGMLSRAPASIRFIELKYLLLDGVNDSPDHATELAEFARGLEATVCLQIYNRIEGLGYEGSPAERVRAFASQLRGAGARVDILNSNLGGTVDGGCGQLRARILPRNSAPHPEATA
ncbi:MAG: radical SAM protein [Deltaproteobacteria bacterium]|nr:radical SAM protein [Deltaproteobacteria bacterium]